MGLCRAERRGGDCGAGVQGPPGASEGGYYDVSGKNEGHFLQSTFKFLDMHRFLYLGINNKKKAENTNKIIK